MWLPPEQWINANAFVLNHLLTGSENNLNNYFQILFLFSISVNQTRYRTRNDKILICYKTDIELQPSFMICLTIQILLYKGATRCLIK